MKIIGMGLDMVELTRVNRVLSRFGTHFLDRIMNKHEQNAVPGYQGLNAKLMDFSPRAIAHVAARFAAKEAVVKAFGTGFSEGITPCEIEVCSAPSGKPELVLHGNAAKKAESLGVRSLYLTLTHTRDNAAAVVILEG